MKLFTLGLLLLTSMAQANAKEVKLLEITNQQDKHVTVMNAVVNENNEITSFNKQTFDKGVLLRNDLSFTVDQGNESEGVVLKKVGKRNVIIAKAGNLSPVYGGPLTINFLKNGGTGSRGNFEMELLLDRGRWQLHHKGKRIKHIKMITNKFWRKVLGIKKVQIIN